MSKKSEGIFYWSAPSEWVSETKLRDEINVSKKLFRKLFKDCNSKIVNGEKHYKTSSIEKIIENPSKNQKILKDHSKKSEEKTKEIEINKVQNELKISCERLKLIPYKDIMNEALIEEAIFKKIPKKRVYKYSERKKEYVTFKYIRHYYIDNHTKDAEIMSKYDLDGYNKYKENLLKEVLKIYPNLKEVGQDWVNDIRKKDQKTPFINKKVKENIKGKIRFENDTKTTKEYDLRSPEILKFGRIVVYDQEGRLAREFNGFSQFFKKMCKHLTKYDEYGMELEIDNFDKDDERTKLFNCMKHKLAYVNPDGKTYVCKMLRHAPENIKIQEVELHKQNLIEYNELMEIIEQGHKDNLWKVRNGEFKINNLKTKFNVFPVDKAFDELEHFLDNKMLKHFNDTGLRYEPNNLTENMILDFLDKKRERQDR